MDYFIQALSLMALLLAYKGSKLFVESNFELGSKLFMIGNTINMALALGFGNLYFFIAQASLMFFTLNMIAVKVRLFYVLLSLFGFILMSLVGLNDIQSFSYSDLIDLVSTICAIYGAYKMSKQDYKTMAIMWIVADFGFMIVAVKLQLIGLFIQSAIFCYHGYLRLKV